MSIVVNLDVVLARKKIRSRQLAADIGITEPNVSLLKSGKVRGIRFETLAKFAVFSIASQATFLSIVMKSAHLTRAIFIFPEPKNRSICLFWRSFEWKARSHFS